MMPVHAFNPAARTTFSSLHPSAPTFSADLQLPETQTAAEALLVEHLATAERQLEEILRLPADDRRIILSHPLGTTIITVYVRPESMTKRAFREVSMDKPFTPDKLEKADKFSILFNPKDKGVIPFTVAYRPTDSKQYEITTGYEGETKIRDRTYAPFSNTPTVQTILFENTADSPLQAPGILKRFGKPSEATTRALSEKATALMDKLRPLAESTSQ